MKFTQFTRAWTGSQGRMRKRCKNTFHSYCLTDFHSCSSVPGMQALCLPLWHFPSVQLWREVKLLRFPNSELDHTLTRHALLRSHHLSLPKTITIFLLNQSVHSFLFNFYIKLTSQNKINTWCFNEKKKIPHPYPLDPKEKLEYCCPW
jgi:hypothetical protein